MFYSLLAIGSFQNRLLEMIAATIILDKIIMEYFA